MKINIIHKNSTHTDYPQIFIEKILVTYLRDKVSFDTLELSVWAVGKTRIKNLNKKFRNIDAITDVLSFTGFSTSKESIINLGEIVYCPEIVKVQAIKYNQSYKDELALYLRHSADHLLEELKLRRVNAKVVDHHRA